MGLTRRGFLAVLAGAVLLGPGRVEGQGVPETRAYRWSGPTGRVARASGDFTAVAVAWPRPVGGLRLRSSADGLDWSAWRLVTNQEQHGRLSPGGYPYRGDLVLVPPSRYIEVAADEPVDGLRLDLIDASDGPSAPGIARPALGTSVPVIPRGEWGCDERLRFDASGAEIWPVVRYVPEKVVVHHTATANQEANTAATVRSIYYYHAVSQGWGDIGYNYLVDWKGNVFEGRYGGPGVEGGHAYGHNPGSIGIACLGSFDSQSVTSAMRTSLARLIAQVAKYLDPYDSGWFVDGEMPNLMGHRDAMQYRPADATACPGNSLQALLPGIRGDVAFNLGGKPTPAATILDVRYDPAFVAPNGTLTVTVTIKNTGTATLSSQDPPGAFVFAERDTAEGRGYPGRAGNWRVGLDVAGGGAAPAYPFRWGFAEALEPGKAAVVQGKVTLGGLGKRAVAVGLVRESRYWAVQGNTPVTVPVIDPSTLTRRAWLPMARR